MTEIIRKLATIEKISAINPIPDADQIERATIRGWNVVVKKGDHKVGELVVYCEIDSLMPERPEFEFLRPDYTHRIVVGYFMEGVRGVYLVSPARRRLLVYYVLERFSKEPGRIFF